MCGGGKEALEANMQRIRGGSVTLLVQARALVLLAIALVLKLLIL